MHKCGRLLSKTPSASTTLQVDRPASTSSDQASTTLPIAKTKSNDDQSLLSVSSLMTRSQRTSRTSVGGSAVKKVLFHCDFPDCPASYDSISSLKRHKTRKHGKQKP